MGRGSGQLKRHDRGLAAQRIGAQLRAPLTGHVSPLGRAASRHQPPRERSEQRAALPRDELLALGSCSALLASRPQVA
jgi:hypothetical protein